MNFNVQLVPSAIHKPTDQAIDQPVDQLIMTEKLTD